jgi:hypothetical protein
MADANRAPLNHQCKGSLRVDDPVEEHLVVGGVTWRGTDRGKCDLKPNRNSRERDEGHRPPPSPCLRRGRAERERDDHHETKQSPRASDGHTTDESKTDALGISGENIGAAPPAPRRLVPPVGGRWGPRAGGSTPLPPPRRGPELPEPSPTRSPLVSPFLASVQGATESAQHRPSTGR